MESLTTTVGNNKSALGQAKIDTQNLFSNIEKEAKNNKQNIATLVTKTSKFSSKFKDLSEEFQLKQNIIENSVNMSLQSMKSINNTCIRENKEFKEFMEDEYIEFFRSKKKMRAEWGKYARESEEKMDEFLSMFYRYDANIATLNLVMPVLTEIVCLNSAFGKEDINARHELS